MLPSNIDLTEHGDFRNRITFTGQLDIPIELWDEDIMTSEDYEKIRRWESIFGKRRHINRKRDVFEITPFKVHLEGHCYRCGKELRLPWKRDRDLCKECSDYIEHDNWYIKFPWRYNRLSVVRLGDRGQGNLFDLR